MKRANVMAALAIAVVMLSAQAAAARARGGATHGRVFMLMVWDGLRPDLVNADDTPALTALKRAGVSFEHHHAVFPSLTMVNGAAIASGAPPGATGIIGNTMYLAPALSGAGSRAGVSDLIRTPRSLENTGVLAALDQPGAFDGKLLEVPTIAHEVTAQHGYVAVIGKPGPTYLFDHPTPRAPARQDPAQFMFVVGDAPGAPPVDNSHPETVIARDAWYTRLAIAQALPAARKAARAGRPALIVLWQQNPDLTQHLAGLGTQAAITALRQCDVNLGRVRDAIDRLGIARRTDLMVISDHGFATIRMEVALGDLLVSAGLKHAPDSDDIVVARNGATDLVYLSRQAFADAEARRAMLARIVDFAAAQDWSGPIFAHAGPPAGLTAPDQNLGWIPGTFSQSLIGIQDAARSPDLVISFRELADPDNHDLTGPANPAFALGLNGQRTVPNHSAALVHPVAGVVYADSGSSRFTTGMGMHGAAGQRELHNFCAAEGPDFRRHFDDPNPSGNLDIAPTIRTVLALPTLPDGAGRVLSEALETRQRQEPPAHATVATAYLVLQGAQIMSQLTFSSFAGHDYLDDSSVTRNPIGAAP